jgi:hypothetical protein
MSKALIDVINARDVDDLARLLVEGENPNEPLTTLTYTPLQGAVSSLGFIPNWKPVGSNVDHVTAVDQLDFLAVPEDPGEQERFHEICRMFDVELVPDEP